VATVDQSQTEPVQPPTAVGADAPQGIELRHLRYFVALADAGSFTHAAERIFIAQPTLSQQIRRLEEIVGASLLQRRREGLRLTAAGSVLLDASRTVLSMVDHEVRRTRQAAGLGRPRLRVVMPPGLPESLAVPAAAGVDVVWVEAALDAEFSLIATCRADAGLGWLTAGPEGLPDPLDAMVLGEFEPEVWVLAGHAAARRGAISLAELAGLEVFYGPRLAQPGTYDAWTQVVRQADPRFGFTDPPFRRSLAMTLAFAAAGDRPAAVLTGPATPAGGGRPLRRPGSAGGCGMVRVGLAQRPLTAAAALVWNGDLPRPLQQALFEAADALTGLTPAQPAGLVSLTSAQPGTERHQGLARTATAAGSRPRRPPTRRSRGPAPLGATACVSRPGPGRP
jgi:DNA-binding transcriptional LysR family regulator